VYKIIGANDRYQACGAENCVAINEDRDWTIDTYKSMIHAAAMNDAIFDDGVNNVIVVLFNGKPYQEALTPPELYRRIKPLLKDGPPVPWWA